MKYITDVVFNASPVTFRLKARNKDVVRGGLWIEQPWMYAKPDSGGWYTGPEILTTVPFDVVQDGSFPWAQLYNNVTVDGLTLNQSRVGREGDGLPHRPVRDGQAGLAGQPGRPASGLTAPTPSR